MLTMYEINRVLTMQKGLTEDLLKKKDKFNNNVLHYLAFFNQIPPSYLQNPSLKEAFEHLNIFNETPKDWLAFKQNKYFNDQEPIGIKAFKEHIKQSLIRDAKLRYIAQSYHNIITKTNKIDTRLMRSYLILRSFFKDNYFNTNALKNLLETAKEDASNINATCKSLFDINLLDKKIYDCDPTTEQEEHLKMLYKLNDFYYQTINDALLNIRALSRWVKSKLTIEEFEIMLLSFIKAYKYVYKDKVTEKNYNLSITNHKKRGRKKANTHFLLLQDENAFLNYAIYAFEDIQAQSIELTDDDMLLICLDALQVKNEYTANSKSFVFKSLIANLIHHEISKTNYETINFIVTDTTNYDFITILYLLKKHIKFNLYIVQEKGLSKLQEEMLKLLNIKYTYISENFTHELPTVDASQLPLITLEQNIVKNLIKNQLFVVLTDRAVPSFKELPLAKDIDWIVNCLKPHHSLFITILPKVRSDEFDAERLLNKYKLSSLNSENINTDLAIKINDDKYYYLIFQNQLNRRYSNKEEITISEKDTELASYIMQEIITNCTIESAFHLKQVL